MHLISLKGFLRFIVLKQPMFMCGINDGIRNVAPTQRRYIEEIQKQLKYQIHTHFKLNLGEDFK
jgi:hypothetical protein